jgi:hypothetical protein
LPFSGLVRLGALLIALRGMVPRDRPVTIRALAEFYSGKDSPTDRDRSRRCCGNPRYAANTSSPPIRCRTTSTTLEVIKA